MIFTNVDKVGVFLKRAESYSWLIFQLQK